MEDSPGPRRTKATSLAKRHGADALVTPSRRQRGPRYVQAYIATCNLPGSLDDLMGSFGGDPFDQWDPVDGILHMEPGDTWTAPQWADEGDIVFFHYAAGARQRAPRLRRLAVQAGALTPALDDFLTYAQDRAEELAGCIFAFAVQAGPAEYIPSDGRQHWKSRNQAPFGRPRALAIPVALAEHSRVLPQPHSGITPLTAAAFAALKELIAEHSLVPMALRRVEAGRDTLVGITSANWQKLACRSDQHFRDETELRCAFCDHFLAGIADPGTELHHEVRCARTTGGAAAKADYVVRIGGRWVPVEVKLNARAWPHLLEQVAQYTGGLGFVAVAGEENLPPSDVALVIDKSGLYVVRDGRFVGGSLTAPFISRVSMADLDLAVIHSRVSTLLTRLARKPKSYGLR